MRFCLWLTLGLTLMGRAWAGTITLELTPSTASVSPGESVTMNAEISGIGVPGAAEVGSFDIFVGFNSALLAPEGVTFGALLGNASASQALTGSTVSPGRVEAAEVSFLSNAQLDALQTTSSFTLATFSFEGIGSGTAAFTFEGGPIDDGNGNLIAGTKAVIPEPDPLPLLVMLLAAGVPGIRRLCRLQ